MALDVANLGFSVDSSALRTAKTDLDAMAGAAGRAAPAVQEIISRATGLASSGRTAADSTREWVAELNRQAASFDSLRTSVDPAFAATKRYEAAVEQANAAVKAGIVSQGEANRVLQSAAQAYQGASRNVVAMEQAARTSGGVFQRYQHEIRNTSYQLQDMAVQISTGTDVMRTMSMQLPQLLGGFGAWGAVIGVVVGVLGGVMASMKGWGGETDRLKSSLDSLNAAMERSRSAADNADMKVSELAATFGQGASEASKLYEQIAQLARLQSLQTLNETTKALVQEFSGLKSLLDTIDAEKSLGLDDSGLVVASVEQIRKQFSLTVAEARMLTDLLNDVQSAKSLSDKATAAQELAGFLADGALSGREFSSAMIAAAVSASDVALAALESANSTDTAVVATNNWAASMAGVAAQINAIAAALAGLGGGVISRAAMFVERNAIAAGKSVAQARIEVEKFNTAAKWDAQIMGAQSKGGIFGTIAANALGAAKAVEMGNIEMAAENAILVQNAQASERAAASTAKKGGASKGAGKSAKTAAAATRDLIAELNKELDARQSLIGLYGEERDRMEALQQVQQKLGKDLGKYSAAAIQGAADRIVAIGKEEKAWEATMQRMDSLTDSLAGAFGDWISSGLRNFKDFTSAILGSFKSMISDMIATAVRNPIQLTITGAWGGMGGAGAAVAGVPGAGGAGMLGGIGAAVGGLASWGTSGAVAGFTGLMSGGVGGALTAVGTQAALAGGGLSSLAVGLGAIAAPVATVAGLFSFFKKSTKELDRGLRVTVEGMDTLVETFTRTETRRFWGLSKKRKTSYDPADAATADPIEAYVAKMQTGVMEMAKLLGVGAGAFENFSAQIKLSTKDMTDEQAIQAIHAELTKLGDEFAGLVPDLAKFSAEGEGALATLTRLSASLAGVNASLGDLGLRLYDLSVNGAGAAAAFAGLFGGLDQFQQAAGAYYKEFYSDAERMTRLQEVSTKALRDAGLAVPATREAYRALVDAQNLSTDAGRKAAAVLLQLAPAFDQMFDAAEAARLAAMQAIADANASRAGLLDSLMTDQQRAVQAQAEITATFAALNMTVPTTLEGLRAIIAGLDLTSEAGRTALAQIAGIADALKDKLIPVQSGGGRQSIGGGSPGNNAAEERERLERQLLQLQGNTFELRQRELNALAPANRALQEMIWRLEDAKDAMDNLKTDGFATLVDFELARARQANSEAAPVALKAQETRQRQDSATLTEIRDYMFTVANNTHRAARETRDLRMLQEGTGA